MVDPQATRKASLDDLHQLRLVTAEVAVVTGADAPDWVTDSNHRARPEATVPRGVFIRGRP